MKKILYLVILMSALFALMACGDKEIPEPDLLDVTVMNEELLFQQIKLHVVVPIQVANLDELMEITLDIARQTYEKHFDLIDIKPYTLTVYLYQSEAHYNAENASYGYHVFDINVSLEQPGLSLSDNQLKLN
jgi:hypothetical protein